MGKEIASIMIGYYIFTGPVRTYNCTTDLLRTVASCGRATEVFIHCMLYYTFAMGKKRSAGASTADLLHTAA
jgi:hypothetical protein